MTHANNLTAQARQPGSLVKHMLIGAGIGLAVIALFVLPVKHPRAEWGQFWMLRPLIITPLAAAGGGLGTYFVEYLLGYKGGWSKIIAVIISIVGFIISLWLGTVLGFAGTLWN